MHDNLKVNFKVKLLCKNLQITARTTLYTAASLTFGWDLVLLP